MSQDSFLPGGDDAALAGGHNGPVSEANAAAPPRRRWLRLTPGRLVVALLAFEGFLLLSEHFRWFGFHYHKGWTVLIAVAAVGAAMLLMLLWFLAALIFRWRFQYTIRSLLLLTAVVAIPCSWLAVEKEQARTQQVIVEEISEIGWTGVHYDYEFDPSGNYIPDATPPAPEWLCDLLGGDMFGEVVMICFFDNPPPSWDPETRTTTYPPCHAKVNDALLEKLKELTHLQRLYLNSFDVGDAGVEHLKGLTQLRELDLNGTKVTDAGLEHLKGLTQLRELDLSDSVTDAGLEHLKGLTQLEVLHLGGTKVTDAGLEHLKGLTQLQVLNLDETEVGDAGLEHLKGLTQLRQLRLYNTKIGDAGLAPPQRTDPTRRASPRRHQGYRCRTGTPQRTDPTPTFATRRHHGERRRQEKTSTGVAEFNH